MTRRPAAAAPGVRALGADFRKLWGGQSVSLVGSRLTHLALPLLAIVDLHASAGELGVLTAARYAPYVLLAAPAGRRIDACRRRSVLLLACAGQGAVLAAIAGLAIAGTLSVWGLIGLAFALGCLALYFDLAYRAYVPSLVERRELTGANARLSVSESAAEVAGPGLGGAIVQAAGAPFALLLDAASFVVAWASVLSIRTRETVPEPDRDGPERSGYRLTFSDPLLRAFAGEAATYNFFWTMAEAVLAAYAVRTLGVTPGTLGLMLAIGAAGAVLGAVLAGPAARKLGVGTTVIASAVISDVAPVAIPLAGDGSAVWLALIAFALFTQGVGMTGCNVHVMAIRQAVTPAAVLARTLGSYESVTKGCAAAGALAGGALGASLGLRETLAVAAAGLLTTALWFVFSPVRGLASAEDAVARQAPMRPQIRSA